jgi:O-antigen/teichoic acid export membrane protein
MSASRPPLAPALRRNALANVLGRGASALIWVAVTPFALARLGPERFGVWSLFLALSGYFAALDFGMASAVARWVALGLARGEGRAASGAVLRALTVALGLGVIWLLACVLGRAVFCRLFHVPDALAAEVRASLLVFGASMALLSVSQVYQGALAGLQRLDLSNVALLGGLSVNVAILLVGLARGGGLAAVAWAAFAGQFVCASLAWRLYAARVRALPSSGDPSAVRWRDIFAFGGMVQITNALIVGQMQAPKFVIGAFGSLAEVTVFELGWRVANAVWSMPLLIQGALVPAAARASATGPDAVRDVLAWGTRWMTALTGVMLAGLALGVHALFRIWLGAGHDEAAGVAMLLALAFALGTPAIPGCAVARGAGRPDLEATGFAIALAVNTGAMIALVPGYGVRGAAIAQVISFAIMSAGVAIMLGRWLRIPLAISLGWAPLARLALPALAAAGVAWATASWPLLAISDAFRVGITRAVLFVILALGAGWITGDTRALLAWARRRADFGPRTAS